MRFASDSIDTLAAHAGRDDLAALGVHAPPIDLSSTYPFPDLDQATGALDAFAAGAATAATPIYGSSVVTDHSVLPPTAPLTT